MRPSQYEGLLFWPWRHDLQTSDAGELARLSHIKYVFVIASMFGGCWQTESERVCRHRNPTYTCSGSRGDARCADPCGIVSLALARHLVRPSELMLGLFPTTRVWNCRCTDTPLVSCRWLDPHFVLRVCKGRVAIGQTRCQQTQRHVTVGLDSAKQLLLLQTCFCLRHNDLPFLSGARKPVDEMQGTDIDTKSVFLWDVAFIMSAH